jgi:hypothetical protein
LVRAPVGAFEHLVGDPLVDRERVGGPVALAALGEPQPDRTRGRPAAKTPEPLFGEVAARAMSSQPMM